MAEDGIVLTDDDTTACTTADPRTTVHVAPDSTVIEVEGSGGAVDVPCSNGFGQTVNLVYQFVLDPAQ